MKSIDYPTYRFKDHDPVLDELLTLYRTLDAKLTELAADARVSRSTLVNWGLKNPRKRKVRRPQFATVKAVARAMGGDVVISGPAARGRLKLVDLVAS